MTAKTNPPSGTRREKDALYEAGSSQQAGSTSQLIELGRAVIDIEAQAVAALAPRIDHQFEQACQLLLNCNGRIIVSGVGKSGHIGSKIAATLSSTGSPAFFVHPAEASHGDLGMVTSSDVFIAISKSGRSDELMTLLPILKRLDIDIIALTGNRESPLATTADVHLDIGVDREACPLGLAPTASTTATLAMGDALAIALLGARGFTEDDFALSHPGGSLGRKLLLRVGDVMTTGAAIPSVLSGTSLPDTLVEISRKNLGLAVIVDADDHLCGIFTDGDLRRAIDDDIDIRAASVDEVMTAGGRTITADALAAEAVSVMQEHTITVLPVINDQRQVTGILHMHMLLAAGVV